MEIRRSILLFFILGALFVGLTMALGPFGPSETPEPIDDEPNWMIKIEDMTYNSRNFTIDQEITSLDKESATIVDREGNALEIDLCPVLPFMELSNTVGVNEGRNSNLILNYDTDDCSFAIIEKSNSETSQNNMRLHGNVIRADSGQLINGYALAELQAEDSIDFGLTQTETRMLVDADTLFKHSYDNDCDADSPAGLLGNWSIDWYNDACRSAPFTNATSYVMGNTEGA